MVYHTPTTDSISFRCLFIYFSHHSFSAIPNMKKKKTCTLISTKHNLEREAAESQTENENSSANLINSADKSLFNISNSVGMTNFFVRFLINFKPLSMGKIIIYIYTIRLVIGNYSK